MEIELKLTVLKLADPQQHINMDYPKRWSSLFAYHQTKIDEGVFGIYNPDVSHQTFGVLLLPSEQSKKHIYAAILESLEGLSDKIISKLFIQLEENIHFSVQWSDKRKIKGERQKLIIDEIKSVIADMKEIKGDLFMPFNGYGNLYGLMRTDQILEVSNLRYKLENIFHKYSLKSGIPEEDFDLIHTSLMRFLEQLSEQERSEVNIQIKAVPIILDQIVITFNDKVMSSEHTQILYRHKLG